MMSRKRKAVTAVPVLPEQVPAKGEVLWRARHRDSPSITTTVWAPAMSAFLARARAAVKLQCDPLQLDVERA